MDTASTAVITSINEFLHAAPESRAKIWRRDLSATLMELLGELAVEDLGELVLSPNRFGPRSVIPWVAFLTPEISPNVQSGYYPLLLLDESTQTIYVCLAVAWNQFARRHSPNTALSKNLEARESLLEQVRQPLLSDTLQLSASAPFARILEQVCFSVGRVELGSEIAAEEFTRTLRHNLEVYVEMLQTGNPQVLSA